MTTNISKYVQEHWSDLPKSTFNDEEVVIVREDYNSNEGWGNHSYNGVGIDAEGRVLWCFSSGCSCHGTCGMEHKAEDKVLEADFDLTGIDPATLDFNALQVSYSDY